MPDLTEQALPLAMTLCRQFEGLRLHPYLCPAGVPTIGYGCTRYGDGRAVRLSDPPITEGVAKVMLANHLRRECLPVALELVPKVDTPGRLAALADFVFNLGRGRFEGSALRRRAAAGDWAGAKVELGKWIYGGGQKLPGLISRREAEAALL
jgi:lysozyme